MPGATPDDSAPGTVFTTDSHGGPAATWIVIDRREDGMRYARFIPDRIAGTIEVTCSQGPTAMECLVAVTYDMTSLSVEGVNFVDEHSSDYDAFLESWLQDVLGMRDA